MGHCYSRKVKLYQLKKKNIGSCLNICWIFNWEKWVTEIIARKINLSLGGKNKARVQTAKKGASESQNLALRPVRLDAIWLVIIYLKGIMRFSGGV